jgi:hypothetical protein
MVRSCGIAPTELRLSKSRNSLDCDERRSSFTPLIRLPAVRMPHALDIRRYTRTDLAGSLDGFRLRWRYGAGSVRTRFANGKITLRSLFHIQILPVH